MRALKVVLFGASGHLGQWVDRALTARSEDIAVVRVGRGAALAPDRVRYDLVTGDPAGLDGLLESVAPDVVVNCAGRLDGTAAELVAANVTAVARLLDAMPSAAPGARLVTVGSAAEYGVVPEGHPVTEDAPERPVSPYGATKLAGTALVRAAVAAGRLEGVVLRVFNPIGPGTSTGTVLGRAAAALRAAAATGERVVRLGPLDAHRDFVDVRDVADAVAGAALAPAPVDPVLNVGLGTAVLVREAVELLVETSGFSGRVAESGGASARSGTVGWIAADPTRTRRVLGWSPRHDLASSVRDVWAWST
ncbi:NAD-dependent epimerase/dehydratase family protein [Saccharothrix yanglingensis]|uniref:NAD-dependent dehydratase n=1 Tax=Saccharothrix yanglingensis TaxID=659496 RepID=A0ABU0XAD8_9PSEU|nr:NAD-dependent epimerase/dehydratase family protein [Saccharothrix yanglingensis]MDQ2589102.1 NAD-dependent dehydratase [Saccharothrix yanglingensis]